MKICQKDFSLRTLSWAGEAHVTFYAARPGGIRPHLRPPAQRRDAGSGLTRHTEPSSVAGFLPVIGRRA